MEDASDPRRLRDAFGCFGTGVTLVSATNPEGGVTAVTANSFTSVSLEPPLLLFCLSKRSRRLPVFEHAEAYAVNVLHADQERLSSELARGDGCEGLDWRLEAGAPVLADAMASFACAREAVHEGGDHLIFLGRIVRLSFDPTLDPLLYFQGRYRSVHVPD
jgi:flavin reductase (DIM6/NTAB) family NADH-FMN oxidoreductase RutF